MRYIISISMLLVLSVTLAACGSPQSGIIVSNVVSQSHPTMAAQAIYDDVKLCLAKNYTGTIRAELPTIVITLDAISCSGVITDACTETTGNNIYFWQTVVNETANPDYVKWIYAHEFIHWLTNIGNEGHNTMLFQDCANPFLRGTWSY